MPESNTNSRLEAFCDGVFAIALTLLIIDIKVPNNETISTTKDLWLALQHLLPAVLAFLLSFIVIFISWVNHHATLKLVDKSASGFIYANGFFLLTIVVLPFPTALLSEYLFTDHASPAVVVYAVVMGFQSIGWILLSHAALHPDLLTKNEKAALAMRNNARSGYLAAGTYALLAVLAFWIPQVVALLISAIWIFWLIYGMNIKGE